MSGDGSDDAKKKRAAFRTRPGRDGEYEVGYGKPPKETRFRKGRSGNPKGRPKGSKTSSPDVIQNRFMEIIQTEAYREIPLREGGRESSVPLATAIMKSIAVKAARGNMRAAELFTELLGKTEQVKMRERLAFVEEAIEYKMEAEKEIERCRKVGLPEPDLCPHPDQIHINVATGEVHFTGPLTKEDRKAHEDLRKRKAECEAELDRLRLELKRARKPEDEDSIREDIARCEKQLATIRRGLPKEDPIEAFQRDVERRFPTEG